MTSLMMDAASASETSVNFYQTTWRKNPEDSHLRTHRRENVKSHTVGLYELLPSGCEGPKMTVKLS
jgi:hypothetical protein